MKSLMLLARNALLDCGALSGTTTTRDWITVERRTKDEGVSFLTLTLGSFCDDFERSLANGSISPDAFQGFGKHGAIPKFLSGMLRLIFSDSGRLLQNPSITSIQCIRQFCRMWKKILLPCAPHRTKAVLDGYVAIERELHARESICDNEELLLIFDKVSSLLWSDTLQDLDLDNLIPRHGPGATAEKLTSHQRYNWSEWSARLNQEFPVSQFAYYDELAFKDSPEIALLTPAQERPVRVVTVPKTLKGERIIAIEPACMQYTQQSILHPLVVKLESARLTSGRLNFTDQDINRNLALVHSKSGYYATIDMKDASDRVNGECVSRMLRVLPRLRDKIMACRSTHALLPTGVTIQLKKFASMGSGLCFPMEAMVFYTIILSSIILNQKRRVSAQTLRDISRHVYVYGDDIVIPVGHVPHVVAALESFGLKCNSRKSFWTGKFRESCGMDAYDGVDITTIYIRHMPPNNMTDVSSIVSYVDTSNQLFAGGWYNTCKAIEKLVAKATKMTIPYAGSDASYLHYERFSSNTVHRFSKTLHRAEVKALCVEEHVAPDPLIGYGAVTRWFLSKLTDRPSKKYQWDIRGTGRLTLKRRWCPVR